MLKLAGCISLSKATSVKSLMSFFLPLVTFIEDPIHIILLNLVCQHVFVCMLPRFILTPPHIGCDAFCHELYIFNLMQQVLFFSVHHITGTQHELFPWDNMGMYGLCVMCACKAQCE